MWQVHFTESIYNEENEMANEVVVMKNVSKEFKTLNRHEGLKGSFKDLFSRRIAQSYIIHPKSYMNEGDIIKVPPYMFFCMF